MSRLAYIIGGSPSSGSSLLAHYLGNHSDIYAGPETNLLTHSSWMTDWKSSTSSLSEVDLGKIKSSAWHIHEGVQTDHFNRSSVVLQAFRTSDNLSEFLEDQFDMVTDKKYFLMKTPSNSVFFDPLRKLSPSALQILTVRNPYDSIASMRRRGWSIAYAAGAYLFNIGLGYQGADYLKSVRYEDLVNQPRRVMKSLLSVYDLVFQDEMIDNPMDKMIDSWVQHDSTESKRTFDLISENDQRMINFFIDHLKFKDDFKFEKRAPRIRSIREIMEVFNYSDELHFAGKSASYQKARLFLTIEKLKRLWRLHPLSGRNFPFEFSL